MVMPSKGKKKHSNKAKVQNGTHKYSQRSLFMMMMILTLRFC